MAYHVDSYDKAIVIDGFDQGIGDSPYAGIANMRNVDIGTVPGEASVAFATAGFTKPATVSAAAITGDAGTDVITVGSTSGWYNGMAVYFPSLTGGSGLTANRPYWVINLSGNTFQVAISPNTSASAIDFTTNITSGTVTSYTLDAPIVQWTTSYAGTLNGIYGPVMGISSDGRAWWVQITAGVPTGRLCFLGNTTLTGGGGGCAAFNGYLFLFRGANVDYVSTDFVGNPTQDMSTSWVYGWKSCTNTTYHYALSATDNAIYFCNAFSVGSILAKTGTTFDPTSSSTYTYTASALALPNGDQAMCLAELGTGLLVGGLREWIYPWNRVDPTFDYPIKIGDTYTWRIVTINTNAYIFAGKRGRIYVTNGAQAQLFKKVPDHLSGTVSPYFEWGDSTAVRNRIYFGVRATNNAGTAISQYGGVWALDVEKGSLWLINQLSYGSYAGYVTAIIPASAFFGLLPTGYGYYAAWDSGSSTYGADYTLTTPYTGGQAVVEGDLIPIGTYQRPRNASQVEFKLNRPLVSGESVAIYYRLIFNDSSTGWTLVFTESTAGKYASQHAINFKNAQWLQLQAVLTSTASSPSFVRLTEMRLTEVS